MELLFMQHSDRSSKFVKMSQPISSRKCTFVEARKGCNMVKRKTIAAKYHQKNKWYTEAVERDTNNKNVKASFYNTFLGREAKFLLVCVCAILHTC